MTTHIRGFTLYELLLTTILIALISGLAIPSYSAGIARQRQRVEIDALFHAMHLARKESVMRRKVISLCPSLDGSSCAKSRDWSNGWLMFENNDRDSPPVIDPGEVLLKNHRVDDQVRITAIDRHLPSGPRSCGPRMVRSFFATPLSEFHPRLWSSAIQGVRESPIKRRKVKAIFVRNSVMPTAAIRRLSVPKGRVSAVGTMQKTTIYSGPHGNGC